MERSGFGRTIAAVTTAFAVIHRMAFVPCLCPFGVCLFSSSSLDGRRVSLSHGLFRELNDDLASCPGETIFGSSGIVVRTCTVITVKAFKRETKVEILLGEHL